ncbi:RNA ligase family protein [Epibacterium ulvae]|uniref:RNA ligase family protein n=1 Tax=Epibacterium ulvae TaxID=1156985 RepID=UPI001BFC304F|nr:RNA ligase family protein [Epibacterium ulvae]MBT8153075.1 RNA ligase family protein [Epibacterium ulvae]
MSQKYGRTYHLPQSPGLTKDDRRMPHQNALATAIEVVATEKMDGENTTIHPDGTHPRSLDARYHPSRDWMKTFAAGIAPQLRPGERIIGEYLFARHSISYQDLPSYSLGFAWSCDGVLQSWDDTVTRFAALGIAPVPVLYRGAFGDDTAANIVSDMDFATQEGFVLRDAAAFPEAAMPLHMGKYVRAGHVQSEVHWTKGPIVKNTCVG